MRSSHDMTFILSLAASGWDHPTIPSNHSTIPPMAWRKRSGKSKWKRARRRQ